MLPRTEGNDMLRLQSKHAAFLASLALTVTGCSAIGSAAAAASGVGHSESPESAASPAESPDHRAPREPALPVGSQPVSLDPAQFSANITNPYWPMKPGTRWTYAETDGTGANQKVVMIATTMTKKVANGITARVVRDTVTENGQLVEDTFDWYAQDRAGNVWYLGEDTAEFANGKLVNRKGTFEAGVDGALPGIAIPAEPRPGMAYRQEYYKGQAEDNGAVLSTREQVHVAHKRFTGALMTSDTSTIDATLLEYKFYARGVGPVLVLSSAKPLRQELISVDRASANAGTGPLGTPNP
jgi:hypothetical protein